MNQPHTTEAHIPKCQFTSSHWTQSIDIVGTWGGAQSPLVRGNASVGVTESSPVYTQCGVVGLKGQVNHAGSGHVSNYPSSGRSPVYADGTAGDSDGVEASCVRALMEAWVWPGVM